MATYTKLRNGRWGVRVAGNTTTDAIVTVTKRSGEQKLEKVEKVLWTGKDRDGKTVSLCAISSAPATSDNGSSHSGAGPCAECGERRGKIECLDSSGISGECCAQCARMSRFDRSYS